MIEEPTLSPIKYSFFPSSPSSKELVSIEHKGCPDESRSMFSCPTKKPFWPETLWKGGTLVYSMRQPEKCLGPPVIRNDRIIRFNSRFESGNLMYAYKLSPDSYHLILEYDHTTSGQCQWFYFQMSNIRKDRKVTFYISGFNKNSGVFSSGSKVFMYSTKKAAFSNVSWYRTGTNYAYGVTLKNKNNKRATLQFQIQFPYDDDVCYLCYAPPYTFTNLKDDIKRWENIAPDRVSQDVLCKTVGGRDCPILTITSNKPSTVNKKCIFLTARMHPGETNGSFVLKGFIDYILSKNNIADQLLEKFVFKIIPMVNIDGVVEGFYRCGLEGDDLNRVWASPDPYKHPVIFHAKQLIQEISLRSPVKNDIPTHEEISTLKPENANSKLLNLNDNINVTAYIDFHGHSRQHGTFAYACPTESESEKTLPRIIAYLCDAFSWAKCVFSVPTARKDAARCVVQREFNVINSFTIESSFGGILVGPRSNTLYNEIIWKEIGEKTAEALYHRFGIDDSPLLKLIEFNGLFNLSPLNSQNNSKSKNQKPQINTIRRSSKTNNIYNSLYLNFNSTTAKLKKNNSKKSVHSSKIRLTKGSRITRSQSTR